MLKPAVLWCAIGAGVAAQGIGPLPAPRDLTRLQDFTAERVSSNNADPDSNDDSWRPIAGETVTLADLTGPGVVTHIWLTVAANEYAWPRLLRLRVYYDGSHIPGVDAPVGDFFAVGHGFERAVSSLMIRDGSSGRSRNSYWQMPFARRIRITITNEGRRRVSNLYFHVDWKKLPVLPADTLYFHARYRQQLPARPGKPYEILSVSGRGHYVGTVFSIIQNQPGWFGEGDEAFHVDGAARASIVGTGTEDYFNDAWSFRVSDGLYTGVPVAEGTGVGARMSAYRWHIVDPVPFRRSLRLDIEHKGWTYNPDGSVRSAFEERADLFSSVAFWYQAGIAADQPPVPYGSRRLPLGHARQIEVEASLPDVAADGGSVSVQKDVFWSKDILLFEGTGPGSKVTVHFDVPAAGRYELVAQLAHSPDYGVYTTLLDGKPTASGDALEHEPGANAGDAARIDAWFSETYVAEDHLIGWATLSAGRHTLTFVCAGRNQASTGYKLGIDTLILASLAPGAETDDTGQRAEGIRALADVRPLPAADRARVEQALRDADAEVRAAAAWTLGEVTMTPRSSIDALASALSDADHVVRGLTALALRNAGQRAASTRDNLVKALADSDDGVRMMAAQALGRLQDPAIVEPLIAVLQTPGQHVHVLRSAADALGALGPRAAPALPALREVAKLPRAAWSANLAISRIEPRR